MLGLLCCSPLIAASVNGQILFVLPSKSTAFCEELPLLSYLDCPPTVYFQFGLS